MCLQCVAVCCSVLQCVAVCCSVLQCVAVYCSVLQCVMTFDASIVSFLLDSLYKMGTERTFSECVPVCCCNEVVVTEHER